MVVGTKVTRSYAARKLASLLPTTEGFLQNAKRALKSDPLSLNPPDYCWEADDNNKNLYPTTLAEGVCMAPDCVLKLIRCGCDSEMPCRSGNCGCTGCQIQRTIFCACRAGLPKQLMTMNKMQTMQRKTVELASTCTAIV